MIDYGADLTLPDSALAARALDEATSVLPPSLLAHSVRTFLLAHAYAADRGIGADLEGLFVAAMLHDLGLASSLRDRSAPFMQVGARRLVSLLAQAGQPTDRAARLARAIELHMRLFPHWSAGPEAGLLQVAAWMDVLGRRRRQVPAALRTQIARSHPRGDLAWRFPVGLVGSIGSWRACAALVLP